MNILITGISGFLGRNFAELLQKKKGITVHGLIRPGTSREKLLDIGDNTILHNLDLADTNELISFLAQNRFDVIYHIGALRGGRRFDRKTFFAVNVNATEQLVISALEKDSRFVFCSSVGVFGTIPSETPAHNNSPRNPDNFYHFTKIRAESIIQNKVLQGLKSVIIRPSIVYGPHDFGFPYTLTRLIDKKLMFYPDREVEIHLTNIDFLSQIFLYFLERDFKPGREYTIADIEPVKLRELVNFISRELRGKDYPKTREINGKLFDIAIKTARFLKKELWTSRFELISRSWYYDIQPARTDIEMKPPSTIPTFKNVINWYKKNS